MEDFTDQIGERLSRARDAAGLSVDDVMFRTRIPRSVIEALEAGNFSIFSSPTYAKSFLSQYSEFLDVDARLWLDALQPASFISGEFVQPLWKEAGERKEEKLTPSHPQMGWLSAATVLAISGGLVFLAMKGYDLLEQRFGNEGGPLPVAAPPATTTATPSSTVAPPLDSSMTQQPRKRAEEDLAAPPPRAIIVR